MITARHHAGHAPAVQARRIERRAACSTRARQGARRRGVRRAAALFLTVTLTLLIVCVPRLVLTPVAALAALGSLVALLYIPFLVVALLWSARSQRDGAGPAPAEPSPTRHRRNEQVAGRAPLQPVPLRRLIARNPWWTN